MSGLSLSAGHIFRECFLPLVTFSVPRISVPLYQSLRDVFSATCAQKGPFTLTIAPNPGGVVHRTLVGLAPNPGGVSAEPWWGDRFQQLVMRVTFLNYNYGRYALLCQQHVYICHIHVLLSYSWCNRVAITLPRLSSCAGTSWVVVRELSVS